MNLLKEKWRPLLADLACWSYLGYLGLSQQFFWASVWVASVLILNFVYSKKPSYVVVTYRK